MLSETPLSTAHHSRFVQRVRRRYASELHLLEPGLPDTPTIDALIDALCTQGHALPCALRIARHLVIERLAVHDIELGAPMAHITQAMTDLAEVTLARALQQACAEQDLRFGLPLNTAGERIAFWIVGMGKLGAHELNVSSDIDLIYVYECAGQTHGPKPISAHEYFSEVVRSLYALIGNTTEHGQVFRVDLALRPNGNSGPPVVSLAMLEEYFQVQGREWERFAWLKSRVVAPKQSAKNSKALLLRDVVTSFVYRKHLDYGVFEGLRQLHRKVRDEAQRRAAGRPDRANDVKLSRGGIREIEFIVQLLLVVRGGQFPEIRTRSTLRALVRLAERGLMKPDHAQRLEAAYIFLRRLEHRIQFLDDQQTHLVPTVDADLRWIAQSMGLSGPAELLAQLCETREFVTTEFDALLGEGQATRSPGVTKDCKGCGTAAVPIDHDNFAATLPQAMMERVRTLAQHPHTQLLRDESKLRLGRLITRAAQGVSNDPTQLDAALRFIDWITPLLRRENYLAMLIERPEVHNRLLRLLGLARWPAQFLMRHPGVIDELADERLLHSRFDAQSYITDLENRHTAWARFGQADEESLLDTLRRAHHAEVFRTLVRDVEGHISVEQAADDLSALADATVQCALQWAWGHFKKRHRETPHFAVMAYGKLGGKELGYGSDLDLVFLFDDKAESDPDTASEIYSAFVRKLITWLTTQTAAGPLFDIDTALRPNGNSGLLVTSLASFEKYQKGRTSNTAWTWEHQAITRARFCAGTPALATQFEAVRRAVMCAPRSAEALRQEVQAMREKVRAAHMVGSGLFDVKQSPGGMMDAEFAVQFLVLLHSATHPELQDNLGNITLLQRLETAGLLPQGVGQAAANAYRDLRQAQHRARLDEKPTQFETHTFEPQRAAINALWQVVFLATFGGNAHSNH
jgi:[glutamine synthetase] adenylyltransferase / [glutamine synthetase]-adenylyl-L-tyrosine phosphorylase